MGEGEYAILIEEGGGRRRSKRMSELCGIFEEGEEGRSSQHGGWRKSLGYHSFLSKTYRMIFLIERNYSFQKFQYYQEEIFRPKLKKENFKLTCYLPRGSSEVTDQLSSFSQLTIVLPIVNQAYESEIYLHI